MSKSVKHLYQGFIPENYNLYIDPDRDSMSINGTVTIKGKKTGRPSQRLTFHQNKLKIKSAKIARFDKKGDRQFEVSRINNNNASHEVRLHTSELLYPGSYSITMEFEGQITRPMEGIYPCLFKHDGIDKILIATQFESHHAREAFPCIDEPEAKATFDLTIISPKGETVLGNTPVKSQITKGAKLQTTFETTPKMSTYLLAFVYGELGYKEAKTTDGIIVRTYATPDNAEFTEFALDIAVKSLDLYHEYFDIPFPLAKCDLVALPDFAAGAMENWGLLTFREHALLVDPANTSVPSKQYVSMVVAHEVAHQWFGDLVTMRWWTDLWLNEGFANWMEYLAPDKFFPDWQMWTQYIVDEQQSGLKLDALQNTHPVQSVIKHPDEIRSIFDAISYNKGGSTIQMLAHYLGPDHFRDGLRHYLKKYAYKNTDTSDLWDSLEIVSKKPVKAFMNAWTSQAGFPLLSAEIDGDSLRLSQERFLLNPQDRKSSSASELWPIPLNSTPDLPDILDIKEATYKLKQPKTLKLNSEQSGFYRVIYNDEHLQQLAALVKDSKLGPLDRLGILADTFEAAKAGYMSTESALNFLGSYDSEANNAVWDIMASNLLSIRSVMGDDKLRNNMKPFIIRLSAGQLKRLGWDPKTGESHFDTLLRPTILSLAAISDEKTIVDKLLDLFKTMKTPEDVMPDIRDIVYVTAARYGDEKTFEKLLKMYNQTNSSEDRVKLAIGLTSFKQPKLISKALGLVISDTVRLQDVIYWIAYSFGNRFATEAAWNWMTNNWGWLKDNLGNDMSFARMPIYSARPFSDKEFLSTYKKFFDSVKEPSLDRTIKQGIEMIEWQADWKKRDLKAVQKFFEPKS